MTGERIPDEGAQAERTALSWQRTGLAAVAVGALLIHTDPAHYPLSPWPGVLLIAVGAVCAAVLAPVRYRRVLRSVRAGRAPASTLTIPALSVVLVVVTIGAGSALLLG